jgi:hypothetical protein
LGFLDVTEAYVVMDPFVFVEHGGHEITLVYQHSTTDGQGQVLRQRAMTRRRAALKAT